MKNQIYVYEMECYINADREKREHKLACADKCFDFRKLPDKDIRTEMMSCVIDRGKKLSLLSMRLELYSFNQLCKFIMEKYPDLNSFKDIDLEAIKKKAKVWLMENGNSMTKKRTRTDSGSIQVMDAVLVQYINKIYGFLFPQDKTFNYDDDRWFLDDIPLNLRVNPIKICRSLSFAKIHQAQIKLEFKHVVYIHLSQKAVGTVLAEITAMNRFSVFLDRCYPEVDSLNGIDRDLFEEYLVYIHTEKTGRKSFNTDLKHLNSVFVTAGKILENDLLEHLVCPDDIGKDPKRLYRVYSDAEVERLNAELVEIDVQVARALFIHQILGLRISDTLTLKQDAVFKTDAGALKIRIKQVKTCMEYSKPINDEVKHLFDAACGYTNEKYSQCEYVFVSDNDPTLPMQYGRIHYQLQAMIKKDLVDDHGKPFAVGTHIWRHTYGKNLAELKNVDDLTRAKLMGLATLGTLKYYRQIGNKMFADETRAVRSSMDDILRDIIKEW